MGVWESPETWKSRSAGVGESRSSGVHESGSPCSSPGLDDSFPNWFSLCCSSAFTCLTCRSTIILRIMFLRVSKCSSCIHQAVRFVRLHCVDRGSRHRSLRGASYGRDCSAVDHWTVQGSPPGRKLLAAAAATCARQSIVDESARA